MFFESVQSRNRDGYLNYEHGELFWHTNIKWDFNKKDGHI